MNNIKIFRVTGKIVKPNWKTDFRKELRAVRPEDAIEKVYTEMGSKHRAKRFQIKIVKVEEISPQEIEDPTLRKLVLGEANIVK